ncbi:MAG: hypothetical protein LAT57_05910, partial [Balneolales bacterium]|nr:hypothetical protein [Balneolales bacterium]
MIRPVQYLFIFVLMFLGLTVPHSTAQTLVEYQTRDITWNANPLAPSTVATDVNATNITITGPAAYDTGYWGGSQHNVFLIGWTSALNMSQNYYEFTITAESGKLLNLSEINVGVASESGGTFQGPQSYRLYSNITGFGSNDHIAEVSSMTGGGIQQRILTATLGSA